MAPTVKVRATPGFIGNDQPVPSAAAEIVAKGNPTAIIADALGRQITIKKMNAIDRWDLAKMVGPDEVNNQLYFGYATFAFMVRDIDGTPFPRPANLQHIRAMIDRLDDEGLNAVAAGMIEHFTEAGVDREELKKE